MALHPCFLEDDKIYNIKTIRLPDYIVIDIKNE